MIKFLSKASKKDLRGTALLRLDFNTEDEWRMQATLPTIRFLLRRADKIVVISHRGRPAFIKISAGKPRGLDIRLSLRQKATDLARFLKRQVRFIPNFRFVEIKKTVAAAPRGSVFVLENIRFLHGETTPKPELARKLAGLADYYVNDAFAVSHRVADSVTGVERFLPSYAGLELEQEVAFLSRVLVKPKKPLVIVLGGGKAEDKLGVLKYFRKKANSFLIGGAAANTLLHLQGFDTKKSLRDLNPKDLKKFKGVARFKNIILPTDFAMHKNAILDIGPRTARMYAEKIKAARTIIWSGPLGLIEKKPYDRGTLAVARAVAANRKAFSLAGGGETVMFLKKHGLDKKFGFISTGGGAMLEFLAGKKLPGIAALEK